MTLTTLPVGVFFIREMGLAKIYPNTKFEVSSFTRSKFREGSQNLKKMTLDLTTVNMGVFYNREMGRAKIYLYTKFEVSSFTVPYLGMGSQNLTIWPWTLTTPPMGVFFTLPVGVFFIREMGLAKMYPYTNFEVSSFTRSVFMEGVTKLYHTIV